MNNEDPVVKKIKERLSTAQNSKKSITQQMLLNLHFYLGHQLAVRSEETGRVLIPTDEQLEELRKKGKIFVMIDNQIKLATHIILAELASEPGALYLVPTIPGQRAEDIARVGTKIFDALRHQTNYLVDHLKCVLWTIICGTAFKWVHPEEYNAETIKVVRPNPKYRPELEKVPPDANEDPLWRQPTIEIEAPVKMNVKISILSGFEVFCPAGIDDINTSPWLIIDRYMDREFVEGVYKVKLKPGTKTTQIFADKESGDLTLEERSDQKEVIEYFEAPTPDKPQGGHWVICDDKIIHDGLKHPNWDKIVWENGKPNWKKSIWGGHRIVQYTYEPGLISIWGRGLPESVINHQRLINLLWTMILTNRVKTMVLKLMVPKSCRLRDEDLTDEPGIWEIAEGASGVPRWAEPPHIPPDIIAILDRLYAKFEEQTVGSLNKGIEPQRRMPFLAIARLQEVGLKKFQPQFQMIEQAEAKTGLFYLKALKQFMPQEKLRALAEPSWYGIEVADFIMDDLSDFDVRVEAGSATPQSKAGQIAMSLEAQKYGAIDLSKYPYNVAWLRMIDTPYSRELLNNLTRSTELARTENRLIIAETREQIRRGSPIEPSIHASDHQDHSAHIFEHEQEFNNPAYLRNPAEYDGLSKHIDEHRELIKQKLIRQQDALKEIQQGGEPQQPPIPIPQPEPPMGLEAMEIPPEEEAEGGEMIPPTGEMIPPIGEPLPGNEAEAIQGGEPPMIPGE